MFDNTTQRFRGTALMAVLSLCSTVAVSAQQRDITVTVYHSNLGLVREIRPLQLRKGVSEIKFTDVPARIDPTSVYFISRTRQDAVRIIEQNYEYDLVDADKLLQKHIDFDIMLETKDGTIYSGILLSSSPSEIILRDAQGGVKIIGVDNIENISFPKPLENLITKPTLIWKLDTVDAGTHNTEIGYLTAGIEWHAEYVGITNEDDTRLNLGGWVSIDNRSGATFPDAKLKLVAGDVHRATPPALRKGAQVFMAEAAPPSFAEESFFEYHLYTLQGRTTVANNQVKQISLFAPVDVTTEKKYVYDSTVQAQKVSVFLNFGNSSEAGLGLPLPKGKVRVYKRDADDSLVFIGEDNIDHTPKNETVRIFAGYAFDLTAERTQKQRNVLGKTSWEESWEIELRNSKETAAPVQVIEHLNNGWEITAHSVDFTQKDANTIAFDVVIPGNDGRIISYTVRYQRN